MEKDSKIFLKDEKGITHEYTVIMTFTANENDNLYVIYTDNSVDEDGFTVTYAGIYKEDNGQKSLLPIETDAEWELIDHLLKKLDKEVSNEE